MDDTESELAQLFVIGANRSGTTWVQLLLAQHPAVATSQETHLFSDNYLGHLDRRWTHDHNRGSELRQVGLSSVLSREELHALFRAFVDRVSARMLEGRPGARVVMQKGEDRNPGLILDVVPDVYLLHVIRDPRAVACSVRGASDNFGKRWASRSLIEAVERWSGSVNACRAVAERTDRYREVRYEALSEDAAGEIQGIYAWLGLDADRDLCERAAEACAFDRLKQGGDTQAPWDVGKEPQGFFRKGVADGWREELSPAELELVEFAAGKLMAELGYGAEAATNGARPRALVRYERRKRWGDLARRIGAFAGSKLEGRKP